MFCYSQAGCSCFHSSYLSFPSRPRRPPCLPGCWDSGYLRLDSLLQSSEKIWHISCRSSIRYSYRHTLFRGRHNGMTLVLRVAGFARRMRAMSLEVCQESFWYFSCTMTLSTSICWKTRWVNLTLWQFGSVRSLILDTCISLFCCQLTKKFICHSQSVSAHCSSPQFVSVGYRSRTSCRGCALPAPPLLDCYCSCSGRRWGRSGGWSATLRTKTGSPPWPFHFCRRIRGAPWTGAPTARRLHWLPLAPQWKETGGWKRQRPNELKANHHQIHHFVH